MFISSAIFIFSFICSCCQTCNLSFVIWICVSCSLCPSVALYCLVFVSCLCLQLHSNCFFCEKCRIIFPKNILAEELNYFVTTNVVNENDKNDFNFTQLEAAKCS